MTNKKFFTYLNNYKKMANTKFCTGKIFFFQLNKSNINYDRFYKSNNKFIILYRRDLLAQYYSYLKARKDNAWTYLKENKQADKPIELDIKQFSNYIKSQKNHYQSCVKELKKNNRQYIIIAYEDFISNYDEHFSKLYTFLGVKYETPNIVLKKQNNKHLNECISNYNEIIAEMPEEDRTLTLQ